MSNYTMHALVTARLAVKQAERLNSSVAEQSEALAQLSAVIGDAEANSSDPARFNQRTSVGHLTSRSLTAAAFLRPKTFPYFLRVFA